MRCNERNEEHELACIYTPDGRCRFTLTVERAAILYQQYKRVQEAKPKLLNRLQGGSFAKELYALMCRYKDGATIDSKTHSKFKLANHWATPEEIYRVIQRHTLTSHERFASPLNWSPEFANYYSIHKRDQLFGARWNTYRYKWTETGVHKPEYEDQDLNKNIATAVAATQYTSEPVFGIHILPAWTDSNETAYMRWMELYPENCRHILEIPRKHFRFERPTEWCMGERFAKNPRWDVNIVATCTGNQAGFNNHTSRIGIRSTWTNSWKTYNKQSMKPYHLISISMRSKTSAHKLCMPQTTHLPSQNSRYLGTLERQHTTNANVIKAPTRT